MVVASSSSSSSSTFIPKKHDVFLSFTSQDTRARVTSHLHDKLIQKNVKTFMDDRLPKGDEISPALIEAIQASRISVIIFSENYAFSSWCLDEVVCILKCKQEHGQIVVPVFYNVNPSHVRNRQGSYAVAFAAHEECFKEKMEKVDEWRNALTEVANIVGWESRNYRTESELVQEILKDILVKLNDMSSSDEFRDLIGIHKSIEVMEQLLCIDDSRNVRMIGIWGMGGLGKTTLARVLFQRLSSNFQGCCFLENVREESDKRNGLESLRKRLFSELLEESGLKTITSFHKERLLHKKVLVVLDDVDKPEKLEVLAEDHDWFGPGSRFIITTRDAQVLRDRADKTFELKKLGTDDAFQLFKTNAFKKNAPTANDVKLSKRVVNYADGNPLALKVLGSFLRSRKKDNWEIELKILKESQNERIHRMLKLSFDALDKTEKEIFLDIVCLFRTKFLTCRKLLERRLGAHRSYVGVRIDNLIDKSLITVKDNNTLMIHDLIREMGRKIEGQQRKRSRLWHEEHLYHVLKNKTATRTIEGISCRITIGDSSPISFKEMHRLWMLDIFFHDRKLSQPLEFHLPSSLKCLIWYSCPWKSLPSDFMTHNLVELRMPWSNLVQLWSGVQDLGNLKYVDLSFSKYLTDVSALSQAPNLVTVNLSGCCRLYQVPSLSFRICEQSYHECSHEECATHGRFLT